MGQPFCQSCGQQLQYNCPNCRAIVDFRFSICPNCRSNLIWPGQQQAQPPPTYQENVSYQRAQVEPKKKRNPWLVGVLAFLGGCILVGLLIFGTCPGALGNISKPSGNTETYNPPASTTPTPAPPSAADIIPSQNGAVKFEFAVTDISGSGLSRTITAQITNTGDIDAHNVWGKVEVFCQGSRIKLEGKDFLRTDLGTIASGDAVTTKVTLGFGLMDGLKISQNGATFKLTIYSDELTETFSYDYSP